MEILFTILAFFVLIGIIITIHEGGHFLVGRWCGIKMLEFSLGFGPKIFQRHIGKDKTLFTLRLLPLGGFVKPFDQSAVTPEQWEQSTEKHRTFTQSARWKKILMVAGGPLSNFVLAFVVYFIAMAFIGTKGVEPVIAEVLPQSVFAKAGIHEGEKIEQINHNKVRLLADAYPMLVNGLVQGQIMHIKTDQHETLLDFRGMDLKNIAQDPNKLLGVYFTGNQGDVIVKETIDNSPAKASGVMSGDKIVAIDGKSLKSIERIVSYIAENAGHNLTLTVLRNGKEVTLHVTPRLEDVNKNKVGRIGVVFELKNAPDLKTVRYPLGEALWNSTHRVWDSTYTSLVSIKKLITGQLSTKALSGPLAIADYSGKSAQHGLFQYMMMIAAISIAVGVFNLLPVPVLDGGHLAQYAIEWVIGKEIHPKIIHYVQVGGFGIIMGVFALSMFNDLMHYIFNA